MTTPPYQPPQKNQAYVFYCGLFQRTNPRLLQVNPTLAAGDFQVSTDGSIFAPLTTPPSVVPVGSSSVQVVLSAAEMNGDNIVVLASDQAGAQWCDLMVTIQPGSVVQALVWPAGAIEFTYTVYNAATALPLPDADVWITTDLAGAAVVWRGVTDAFGIARDAINRKPWLDAGTYYFWRNKVGFTFADPDTEVVS